MSTTTISYSEARQNLAKTIKTCTEDYTTFIIKSRHREVVMIPRDEWESWIETMHQLDSPANTRHLEQSLNDKQNHETTTMSPEELIAYMNTDSHEA